VTKCFQNGVISYTMAKMSFQFHYKVSVSLWRSGHSNDSSPFCRRCFCATYTRTGF
jgi:hypothetical protein